MKHALPLVGHRKSSNDAKRYTKRPLVVVYYSVDFSFDYRAGESPRPAWPRAPHFRNPAPVARVDFHYVPHSSVLPPILARDKFNVESRILFRGRWQS